MPDQFTDTTYVSWGNKLSSSVGGVLLGLALFAGSFFLLSWNEGRSIDRIRALDEVRTAVVSVSADKPDPANDGKPVYFSGRAVAGGDVADPVFGLSLHALRLQRTVEMYQWKEKQATSTHQQVGGGEVQQKTYTYEKTWSINPIDSAAFKHGEGHQNPPFPPYASATFDAPGMHVGGFALSQAFISKINNFEPMGVNDQTYAALPPVLKSKFKADGARYASGDSANPAVGDVHVSFKTAPETDASLIGRQNNAAIEAYQAKNGNKVALLATDVLSSDALLAAAQHENAVITWLMRAGGFLMMWIGLCLTLRPLSVLLDIIPLFGGIVAAGIGTAALLLSIVLSAVTIAVAWISVRPIVAFGLLAVAVLAFGAMIRRKTSTETKDPSWQPSQTQI